jgi:copper transport protein
MCRLKALVVLAFLLLGPLLQPASPVSAHALLVRSSPAANDRLSRSPAIVDLWFSEPLDQSFSRVEVRDQNGQRVSEGRIEFNPGDPTQMSSRLRQLGPGIYIVSWRTLSTVDGHQWTGSYPFIVLNPDGSVPEGSQASVVTRSEVPPVELALARWLQFLGGALLLGGLLHFLLIALPASRSLDSAGATRLRPALLRHAVRWGYATAGLMAGASAVELVLQVQTLGGLESLVDFLFRARPGQIWLLRMGLLAACVMLLWGIEGGSGGTPQRRAAGAGIWALLAAFLLATSGYGWTVMLLVLLVLGLLTLTLSRGGSPEDLLTGPAPLALAVLCAAGAVLTYSLLSHAGAVGTGSFWATVVDGVHILAASVWTGGIVGIILAFRSSRALNADPRTRFLALAVARFSPLAAFSVAIIVASGIFSTTVEVPTLAAWTTTTYGRVLLVKLALIVAMLAVAGLNAFVLRPRLVQQATGEWDAEALPPRAGRLRHVVLRTVAAEAGIGMLVLASVGVLAQVPPSRTSLAAGEARPVVEDQGPFEQTVQASGTEVTLRVSPNRAGVNQYSVRIEGIGPGEVQRVRLTFLTTDLTNGGSSGIAERTPDGDWQIEGPYFTFGGPWQVVVDLRRVEKDDVTAGFRLLVAGPLPPRDTSGSPFALPDLAIDPNTLVGAYVLAAGLALLFWRRSRKNLGRWSAPALAVSALAIFIGLTLTFGVHRHLRPVESASSEFERGPEAVARGALIFQEHCAQCHGPTGKGNGPLPPTLNPRPVDLTIHVPYHPDEQILFWIANGLPGTAMPAFKDALTERERHDVLQYLRDLSVPQTP